VKAFSCVTGFIPSFSRRSHGPSGDPDIPAEGGIDGDTRTSTVVHVGGFGLIVVGIFDTGLFGSFEAFFFPPPVR